jgi:hypothetical protein
MSKQANQFRRQGIATGAIIGIIAAVLVVGAVVFYISDPFQSRMKEKYNQLTTWTPENIAKDPKGYLDFCQQQTEKAMQDLKADKIRLAQSRGRLQEMRDAAGKQVSAGESALKELVPQYKDQAQSETVSISWRGSTLNKDQAKKQISTLARQVENQKNLKTKAEAGLRKLDGEASKIDDLETKAKEQLAEIDYNRQLLAANKLTDDLKTRLVNMQAAVAATVNAAASEDGTKSLSEVTNETATQVDETSLDKTLEQYSK